MKLLNPTSDPTFMSGADIIVRAIEYHWSERIDMTNMLLLLHDGYTSAVCNQHFSPKV